MSLKEPRYHVTYYAHYTSYSFGLHCYVVPFYIQASELATFIQLNHDLGCRASLVETIEEGVNAQSPVAAEFWKILGGLANYHCMCPKIENIYVLLSEFK